ncbi:thiamine phosphate synthase [Campylobacter sp. faydin G-105]|uniref:thiamine phosphate synthase n=1 Tax=Campylobacter anatolicus TaxID=2829105 RepID=UPI001BA031C2|nr:thiamine phosphate synthase [Campylobacter anatolicus]MBR8462519.1 thiamine phosphate synthase [Campylobacter anatolicus]
MSQIYALSDDILSPENTIIANAREILKSGVKLYQYRCKKTKNMQIARELLSLCDEFEAKFIVNDDVDFAANIGAKCVHLGKDDASIAKAKRILGDDAFIGVSCYGDINLAITAQNLGASYVAFGAIFTSSTKPNAPCIGTQILKQAKEILDIPICAIGGIDASNITEVSPFVDYIAIVSAIYKPYSITQNIKNLQKAMRI